MSLTPDRFAEFFEALWTDKDGKPLRPFPWQSRLVRDLAENRWPDCIDLPTASGKTSVIDIAVYTLASQATRSPAERTIGRRIFFTVNRRVIVDEAFDRAMKLAEKLKNALKDAEPGILKEVADALKTIGGDSGLPLDVALLRGGIYRDSAWARSMVQPMVICTTVDQLGSRLLFRGYGVSQGMQPIHAALCACDSLVLLDEAHITKAFSQTLRLIQKYQQHQPGLQFVEMTATPSQEPKRRFSLEADDRKDEVLKNRLGAPKPAELIEVKSKSLVDTLVKLATKKAVSEQPKAIGIIVNRVETARDVYEELKKKPGENVHLMIGSMRPLDRDDLQEKLRSIVGPDRPDVFSADAKPVFIVATQCLEVGADYDFDALITECASIDALRQRFGRLNRRGRAISAFAAIVTTDAAQKNDDDLVYRQAIPNTWAWLQSNKNSENQVDFGIASFKTLWDAIDKDTKEKMISCSPDAAVLLPAHLDALCQTNPQPSPSPDVSYFIHGPQRDNTEVNVCWRADLGDDPTLWSKIVSLLPPTSPECMTVPLKRVRQWMSGVADEKAADADVPLFVSEKEISTTDQPKEKREVLRWCGADDKDSKPTDDPNDLHPGDTIVIPADRLDSYSLGHIPDAPTQASLERQKDESDEQFSSRIKKSKTTIDIAERAMRQSKAKVMFRLCERLSGRGNLRHLNADELRLMLKKEIEDDKSIKKEKERPGILNAIDGKFDRHVYPSPKPDDETEEPRDKMVVFRTLVDLPNRLNLSVEFGDDGDDSSCDSLQPLLLSTHVQDVEEFTQANIDALGLTSLATLLKATAQYHDVGKADLRFTAMLAGTSPDNISPDQPSLAKSGKSWLSRDERKQLYERSLLPKHFRHEMLSMQFVDHYFDNLFGDRRIDRDLLLHLIASHHGYARPFAPVCDEFFKDTNHPTHQYRDDHELLRFSYAEMEVDPKTRQSWTPAHRLDSGVAERFWTLTRHHGWWGLVYLESVLRLADQQASAKRQNSDDHKEDEQ